MDILTRIKQLVFHGHVKFTHKAMDELDADGLSQDQAIESIINARTIAKTVRSTSQFKRYAGEKLYIIKARSFDGTLIYTKGAIVQSQGEEIFYFLVSAKVAGGRD